MPHEFSAYTRPRVIIKNSTAYSLIVRPTRPGSQNLTWGNPVTISRDQTIEVHPRENGICPDNQWERRSEPAQVEILVEYNGIQSSIGHYSRRSPECCHADGETISIQIIGNQARLQETITQIDERQRLQNFIQQADATHRQALEDIRSVANNMHDIEAVLTAYQQAVAHNQQAILQLQAALTLIQQHAHLAQRQANVQNSLTVMQRHCEAMQLVYEVQQLQQDEHQHWIAAESAFQQNQYEEADIAYQRSLELYSQPGGIIHKIHQAREIILSLGQVDERYAQNLHQIERLLQIRNDGHGTIRQRIAQNNATRQEHDAAANQLRQQQQREQEQLVHNLIQQGDNFRIQALQVANSAANAVDDGIQQAYTQAVGFAQQAGEQYQQALTLLNQDTRLSTTQREPVQNLLNITNQLQQAMQQAQREQYAAARTELDNLIRHETNADIRALLEQQRTILNDFIELFDIPMPHSNHDDSDIDNFPSDFFGRSENINAGQGRIHNRVVTR